MGKPRIKVRKRRELNKNLNQAVGEDHASITEMERMIGEFIASAKRMKIKPMTLLLMTNQLKDRARQILFHQCLNDYNRALGEPTDEEMEIIEKEFEKMCQIISEESLRTLITKQLRTPKEAGNKRSREKAPSGPERNGEEQPYMMSKERPYYVQ